ncbi:MAG: hypothetical protein ACJ761_01070 [Chloroflexota bacterium]
MDDQDARPGQVTRLPPSRSEARVYSWRWGPDEARRPGLPWIGIFLLVFGALLLVEQLFPAAGSLGSVLVLAVGIAFLVKWAIDRGTGSLYAGAIITALAAPGVIQAIGFHADGLTTFCLGIAFLFIAAIRAWGGGGLGWQTWFGALLLIVGAASITSAMIGGLVLPAVLVIVGIFLVARSSTGRRRL